MQRREFLALTAALASIPFSLSAASNRLPYSPGLVASSLAVGETVFLDFKASWCTTCRAQEKVISALKSQNPDYEKHITIIDVDWDLFGRSDLVSWLKIPRHFTLVVLKDNEELGRIVAGTRRRDIKSLLDIALSAVPS